MVDANQKKLRRVKRKLRLTPAFRQIDMMGIVHNSQYLIWFEEGRLQLILDVLSMEDAIRWQVAMPVIENHCFYRKPVRYDDPLVLHTTHRVQDVYEGRFVFEHSLVHEKTKVEMASGQTVTTLVNMKTGELVREWPVDVWARYQSLI